MKKVLFILILGISSHTFAKDCEKGATTMAEVRACIENESQVGVDKAYTILLTQLKNKNQQLRDRVIASQKSWVTYKHDSCQLVADIQFGVGTGSYRGDFVTKCIMDFNTEREKDLQNYINYTK